ncbi:ABC transporter substrate-binding protein [Nakamurella deserti]|uniref:ABC transporter substrate-binding protein n=1 Tax=Nakamurella deserti TaxID=2164074 RepID=UPI00197B1292|nr:extracellular solute-binding protein [Nakamurella deserti]
MNHVLSAGRPGRTPVSRRSFLAGLGATGAGAMLAACGGPGATATPSSSASTGGTGSGTVGGVTNFYHWRSEDRAALDSLAAGFAARYPGASVTQTIDPSEQYQSTAAQKARDGSIGDALTAFRGTQFNQFTEQDILADLSGSVAVGNYVANLITPGAQDGTQYGFPYQLIFNMPLLNTDLAEKAGVSEVPKDWDAYLGMLDALKGSGVDPIAWPGNDPANAFQIINTLAMNNGPTPEMFIGIQDGTYKATDDWWITSLTQFQQLSAYFQQNFAGASNDGVLALYSQGRAAILPTGTYQLAQVRAAGGSFPIDLAPLITTAAGTTPAFEGVFNATFILAVNAAAKNPAGARAWVEFLSEPANAAAYANATSQHVTVKDVTYENPDLQALAPWVEKKTLLAPRFQFTDADIRSAVENSLVAVVTGSSPEQAAEAAQAIIDEKRGG